MPWTKEQNLERFIANYIVSLLFYSTIEGWEESCWSHYRCKDYEDGYCFAPEALESIRTDCIDFFNAHYPDEPTDFFDTAGGAFARTRNDLTPPKGENWRGFKNGGTPAEFCDVRWPEPRASALTTSAKSYGKTQPYIGDDGMIHLEAMKGMEVQ